MSHCSHNPGTNSWLLGGLLRNGELKVGHRRSLGWDSLPPPSSPMGREHSGQVTCHTLLSAPHTFIYKELLKI